jgi:energy-coupling factor transporter transmembrane protein EcfT
MAVVLAIQSLLFQDGGLAACGANLIDMGAAGCFVGFTVARLAGGLRRGPRRCVVGAARALMVLLPAVALLAVPAGLLAEPGRRLWMSLALAMRALASASAAASLAALLGPPGLVEGARRLHAPRRLVDILSAAFTSLNIIVRQASAMLRAREARRPGRGAWPALLGSPLRTPRGAGRLVAALLLRSLERAEALERAGRARGAGEAPS